jgi:hypothetical protein
MTIHIKWWEKNASRIKGAQELEENKVIFDNFLAYLKEQYLWLYTFRFARNAFVI